MKTPIDASDVEYRKAKPKSSKTKKQKAKLKRKLLTWHKRLGIFSAAFVILLSLTGVLLNHTSSLHLGRVTAPDLVLPLYGIDAPDLRGTLINNLWFLQANDSLYVNNHSISRCTGNLVGAAAVGDLTVIACSEDLIIATADGQLVEAVSRPLSLQVGATDDVFHLAIADCSPQVCLRASDNQIYAFNLDTLGVELLTNAEPSSWASLTTAPPALAKAWTDQHRGQEITWERLILDIHAGRFLGAMGPWLMDFIALLFIILAATGIYLWLKNDRKTSARADSKHLK